MRPLRWAATLAAMSGLAGLALAATTERVVVDRHTGLAIHGYDPVAYFAEGQALPGRSDTEAPFADVIWRFRNEGNRAAFLADPEVYMPQFGGHDPVAVARGVALPGNPLVWLVADKRLYLFSNGGSRGAFLGDQQRTIEAAQARWRDLLRTLIP